jgi:alpha-tubulin suppressor-like RCC1 family protein
MTMLAGCGRLAFDPLPSPDVDAAPDSVSAVGFTRATARGRHTCAVYEGIAYCWGNNASGQIGDGTLTNRNAPTAVPLIAGTIQDLAVGELTSCAIVDGTLYCWGDMFQPTPSAVVLPAPATSVILGEDFVCAIAGGTYCWGQNTVGQLATGNLSPRATPTLALTAAHERLYAGEDHVCALRVSGGAECWGHNDNGTLGFGAFAPDSVTLPEPVDPSITTLPSLGGGNACTVESNIVLCWGTNDNGELGDSTGVRSAVPRVVPGLPPTASVTTGGSPNNPDASCAIDFAGTVRCWGFGDYGRLGQGIAMSSSTPVEVVGLPGPASATTIGEFHACATLVSGELWCWGRGNAGQLGNGAGTSSLSPVQVVPPS